MDLLLIKNNVVGLSTTGYSYKQKEDIYSWK